MSVWVLVSVGCLGVLVATTMCLLLGIWTTLGELVAAVEDHTRMIEEREWMTHAQSPAPPPAPAK